MKRRMFLSVTHKQTPLESSRMPSSKFGEFSFVGSSAITVVYRVSTYMNSGNQKNLVNTPTYLPSFEGRGLRETI